MTTLSHTHVALNDVDALERFLAIQLAEWQAENPDITDGMIVLAFIRIGKKLNALYPEGKLADMINSRLSALGSN